MSKPSREKLVTICGVGGSISSFRAAIAGILVPAGRTWTGTAVP